MAARELRQRFQESWTNDVCQDLTCSQPSLPYPFFSCVSAWHLCYQTVVSSGSSPWTYCGYHKEYSSLNAAAWESLRLTQVLRSLLSLTQFGCKFLHLHYLGIRMCGSYGSTVLEFWLLLALTCCFRSSWSHSFCFHFLWSRLAAWGC